MRNFMLWFLGFLLIPFLSFSQILEPVKWSFKVEQTKPEEATLLLVAKIDHGWHLYAQHNPPPPDGPISTSFQFTKTKNYELAGNVIEQKPIEEKDEMFDNQILRYFSHEAVFKQKIKIIAVKDFTVNGVLEFMCCDNKQCLPPTEVEFSFSIKGNPAAIQAETPPVVVKDTVKTSVPSSLKKVIPQQKTWNRQS